MNGFEQLKAFYTWVFNNSNKVRPTHISLYIFLLNQNNRSMWVEWFKCPFDLAMQGACIGNKNTYYKCLDELQDFGLILYQKGINNYKAPLIKLICLYDSVPLTEHVTVPLSEPQTVLVTEPLTVLLNKNIYKLITDNYKLITDNEKEFVFFVKNEIKTIKEKKEKKVAPKKENIYRSFSHLFITFEEVEKLKLDYDISVIDKILDSIENYKSNTKYKSLYLTTKNWLQKEPKKTVNLIHVNS